MNILNPNDKFDVAAAAALASPKVLVSNEYCGFDGLLTTFTAEVGGTGADLAS